MLFRALQLNAKQAEHVLDDSRLNRWILSPVFTGRQSAKDKPVVMQPKVMLFSFVFEAWGTGSEHRLDGLQLHLPER